MYMHYFLLILVENFIENHLYIIAFHQENWYYFANNISHVILIVNNITIYSCHVTLPVN